MACFMPQKLYGVIGWPLEQSLSPLLHNTGFQILEIPAAYMAWPVPPDSLEIFLKSLRLLKIQGCSITIPHKIAILPYLDSVSEPAALAGAVNTLFWRNDNLCGENTDVNGFLAPLETMELDKMDALLLGAGGAAHAAAAGLRLRGCRHVRVASPSDKRQFELAERFGFSAVKWEERYSRPAKIIVNATPMGMHGKTVSETPYDFKRDPAPSGGIAYDLVYNPLRTRFLTEAELAGRRAISGLEMFFGQGNAQFKLWTGQNLPEQSRGALEKALAALGKYRCSR